MQFEKLALEVSARNAGLISVTPPVLEGRSGVVHRFTSLFSGEGRKYGFDFYDLVSEVEVVRSFAKRFDAGVPVFIVCSTGKVTQGAVSLASEYGLRILTREGLETIFVIEQVPSRRSFG